MPGIRILETGGDTMNSVQSNNFECFHWSIQNFCTLHTAEHSSPCSIVECSALCSVHKFKIIIRDRPFNLKEGGAWFFPKCPPFFCVLTPAFFSLHELLSQTPFSLFSFTLPLQIEREAREDKMCLYSISPNLPKYSYMLVSKIWSW